MADKTLRLTMAQALTRYLAKQMTIVNGERQPLFAGIWARCNHEDSHENMTGLEEALAGLGGVLPTYRSHSEQAMGYAALAFTKASFRQRLMAVSSAIGPGAANLLAIAAHAHIHRLPLLLLVGDVFANRLPDPIAHQLEAFHDATVSLNDCFKPISRYFDRIVRPDQLIASLPRMMQILTDRAECGPVTLALCQDTQTQAFDYPVCMFEEKLRLPRRPPPDKDELHRAINLLQCAKKPIIIAGGGVLYSQACAALAAFSEKHAIPAVETQAGKSAMSPTHALNMGAVGVYGTDAANSLCEKADLILAIGTRLTDITTASRSLFKNPLRKMIVLNIQNFDVCKYDAFPLLADALIGLEELSAGLGSYKASPAWQNTTQQARIGWEKKCAQRNVPEELPSITQIIDNITQIYDHAADSYHIEVGAMGYEIANGTGIKLAKPESDVLVIISKRAYLASNAELINADQLGLKLILILVDNHSQKQDDIDLIAHARSLKLSTEKLNSLADLESAMRKAQAASHSTMIIIKTAPHDAHQTRSRWLDIPIAEVSSNADIRAARKAYERALIKRLDNL